MPQQCAAGWCARAETLNLTPQQPRGSTEDFHGLYEGFVREFIYENVTELFRKWATHMSNFNTGGTVMKLG
jgi:hypothetical protein